MKEYIVDNEKVSITKQDWDFLVILDACRYDLFNEMYKCKKAISSSTWTMEFLNKTFPEYYSDIVYVSANPFVNSMTRTWEKEKYTFFHRMSYYARNHFHRVVDAWKDNWVGGTVHPSAVNKSFHRAYLRFPRKRFVLHYIQPHQPFLSLLGKGIKEQDGMRGKAFKSFPVWKHLSPVLRWEIKKLVGLPFGSELEKIYRRDGRDGFHMVYKNDIRIAMCYVRKLMESISGRWLITSDHGERLVDMLRYEHGGPRDKEVVEVPWLEVST